MRQLPAAAFVCMLLIAWPVLGQEQRGSIEGTITDTQGVALPGVQVEARSPALVGVNTVYTNSQGLYRFPALPPGVSAGGHGGSHGHLTNEFILSLLLNRKPRVNDIIMSLNMTVSGIVAHQSAMKGGELLKIPQYTL